MIKLLLPFILIRMKFTFGQEEMDKTAKLILLPLIDINCLHLSKNVSTKISIISIVLNKKLCLKNCFYNLCKI